MNNVRYAAAAPLLTGAIAADDHSEVSMSIGRNGSNRRSGRGHVMASTILPLPIAWVIWAIAGSAHSVQ